MVGSEREGGQLLGAGVAERIDRVERLNAEAHRLLRILDKGRHRGPELLDTQLRGHLRRLAAHDIRPREDAHADRTKRIGRDLRLTPGEVHRDAR